MCSMAKKAQTEQPCCRALSMERGIFIAAVSPAQGRKITAFRSFCGFLQKRLEELNVPYHHGAERKKFEAHQRSLRELYQQAEMPEVLMQTLYQLDLQEFLDERRHREHTQPLPNADIPVCGCAEWQSRYMWVEEISDPVLAERLKRLPQLDLEILTLYIFEGYSQMEIAASLGIYQQKISRRITRLKKFFSKSV